MNLLEKIKKSLRITSSVFDDEITDLIDAALAELRLSGVLNLEETDPLIARAVTIYCKAHFGLDNPESQKYQESFNALKMHLALSGEHNGLL